ncbi:MAG: ribulose phosphate epimerase, partial [Halieaceae bacterium]|nr:ribulose phosphate epimerase [Halieaceae bacterium]
MSLNVWGSGAIEPYAGKLLVTLQLDGGADVTQLCDPKTNTLGEPKINHWADWADPGQQGNLLYAPIGDNAGLFRRFGADTLVVNGIDAQTNSHETGRLFNWT